MMDELKNGEEITVTIRKNEKFPQEEPVVTQDIKLSVCMIVKDCESDLKRCLDSILPITHEKWCELIIVDTGSTDRTVEVAREYTDKVFIKKFIPWNFSKARNWGIKKAVGKRIFVIDSDHELTQKSLYILEDAVLNPKYDVYKTLFLKIHNYYSTKTGEYAELMQSLIFENEHRDIYKFAVHNRPQCNPPYLFLDQVVLNHYGYLFQKADLFLEKKERSLPMLQAELEKNPDDLHILTHIIKTYYACGDHEQVVELGERWMKLMREVDFHEGWFAYLEVFTNVLASYCALKDGKSAERVMKESLRYTNKLISLYLILGQYYLTVKKIERARELFEEAILLSKQGGDPYEQLCSTNTSVILPEIYNYLSNIEFAYGNYEKAGKYMNEGIRLNNNRLPLRWDIWNEPLCKKQLVDNGFKRKRSA
jgi:glycosyltransferase involved in cell wall biosynthesis